MKKTANIWEYKVGNNTIIAIIAVQYVFVKMSITWMQAKMS